MSEFCQLQGSALIKSIRRRPTQQPEVPGQLHIFLLLTAFVISHIIVFQTVYCPWVQRHQASPTFARHFFAVQCKNLQPTSVPSKLYVLPLRCAYFFVVVGKVKSAVFQIIYSLLISKKHPVDNNKSWFTGWTGCYCSSFSLRTA